MSSLVNVALPVPTSGVMLDIDPRDAPPEAAARLENLRVDSGFARSRFGYTGLNGAAFDSQRVIDIFDRLFADGTGETLRCTATTTQRSVGGAWSAVTLDSNWTGAITDRFWCVLTPFTTETKGRLILGNGKDLPKTWTGGAGTMTAYTGSSISKFGIMGDDGRLFIAYTTESGNVNTQRVRWTVIGLVNGGATDWTGTGSGAIDLRADTFPITGMWRQSGRIYIGKTRAICALNPTGVSTDAYGYETLQTGGEGLFSRGSLVQYGNLVAFVTHRGISVFDGATMTPILGSNTLNFNRRLNHQALDQITSAIDLHANRVGWGLPMDGATTPTELWWYDMDTGHWEIDPIPHTAISLYSGLNTATIDSLAGTIDALSGSIDSLSGTGVNEPLLIFGTAAGATYQFDLATKTDNGNLIAATYVSPAVVPLGRQILMGGMPHLIDEDDFLVVDAVGVRFIDRGDTYTVSIEVSGDGGVTYTGLGSTTITSAGGTENRPRIVRRALYCRCPVKDSVQIRLTSTSSGVLWGWSDATIYIDIVGEKKANL